MKYLLIALALSNCATTPPTPPVYSCPPIKWLGDTHALSSTDVVVRDRGVVVCRKRYRSCVRWIKRRPGGRYWVMCAGADITLALALPKEL